MKKHSKYLEKIVRNQRIVHFSTSNGAHFGPISVGNVFPLIQFGLRNTWKCSLVAFVCFEVFYERTWMQEMLHICNQNVIFAPANHVWRIDRYKEFSRFVAVFCVFQTCNGYWCQKTCKASSSFIGNTFLESKNVFVVILSLFSAVFDCKKRPKYPYCIQNCYKSG